MSRTRIFPMSVIALAVLAGCSTIPERNASLDQARSAYQSVEGNADARRLAAGELRQAEDALKAADAAWTRTEAPARVEHLSYLALQRAAIVQAMTERRVAEQAVGTATAERDQVRLAARTTEAEAARLSAQSAQRDAQAAQRDAEASQRDAQASQRTSVAARLQADAAGKQAEAARRESLIAQQQAVAAQADTADAQARAALTQSRLDELQAKKTERGMVLTIGDVLFDVNRAELKDGGRRSIDRLAAFLRDYPELNAMIEGFTDSTGSDSINAALSARRADAVRGAIIDQGIEGERLSTLGRGDAYPVAGNDTAAGRQLNRRVEVTLSDASGRIAPR